MIYIIFEFIILHTSVLCLFYQWRYHLALKQLKMSEKNYENIFISMELYCVDLFHVIYLFTWSKIIQIAIWIEKFCHV